MWFKKVQSFAVICSLAVSTLVLSSPANAVPSERNKSDTSFVMPNDSIPVATDKSLDTVSDDEYVVVSAPSALKNVVNGASSSKNFFESGKQVVSLVTKKEALKMKASNPDISVETNQPVTAGTVEDNATWGIDRIDSPNLPLSTSYVYNETGVGVTAYIIDSGINTSHTEFTGRIGTGYSALDTDSSIEDCYGHGTHVAGTVGGTKYGVAKGVTLVPLRVFGCSNSGNSLDIMEALQWILDNHAGGPAVINMSLGMNKVQYINDAIATMVSYGFVVVVSAGNEGVDACTKSPASEPTAITVGASDRVDAFMSWSNRGSCVDVTAPGSTVTSAGLNGTTAYANMSGTSMSSPHVTGAVARILEEWPTLTPAEVATKLDEYSSKNVLTSLPANTPNKLLNLPEDINPQITADAPTAPSISLYRSLSIYSAGKVYINGTHSTSTVPITKYTVTATLNNVVYKTKDFLNPDTSQPLALNIDGLMAPDIYNITVTATNSSGESLPSNTISIKAAYSRPSNVTNLTATLIGLRTYDLNWTTVADTQQYNGGLPLSGYRIAYSRTGKVWTIIGDVTPTTNNIQTPQLQPNTIYYIRVLTYSANWLNPSVGKVISFKTSAY